MKNFINKIIEINKQKMKEKIRIASVLKKQKYKEFQLTFDLNTKPQERDKIVKDIFDFGEE